MRARRPGLVYVVYRSGLAHTRAPVQRIPDKDGKMTTRETGLCAHAREKQNKKRRERKNENTDNTTEKKKRRPGLVFRFVLRSLYVHEYMRLCIVVVFSTASAVAKNTSSVQHRFV